MSLAAEGIERTLVHAHGAGSMFPQPQRWLYRAIGPWRETEDQARADTVLLDGKVAGALRTVLFLATEDVGDEPDDDETAALLVVMALIDLMEVADG